MKADLHVHSTLSSDGHQTVAQIIERCREHDIKVLAITDHNVMGGHEEAERLGEGMIIIPGVEISSQGGHVLGLDIVEPVPRGLSVRETIERIHQGGGIAIAPHPFRLSNGLGKKNVRENDFDAVEVVNGRSSRGGNKAARRLATSIGLPGVGGSDAHDPSSVGRAMTEFPDDCRSREDIIAAIRKGRCTVIGTGQSSYRSLRSALANLSRWFGRGMKRM